MQYDVSIIGGGLAGLALSIQLADKGWNVVLFEKERYPFHRVCGEYISMEAWNFLCSLSLPLEEWKLPRISRLQVSAPGGKILQTTLPLGGFGISRYKLDAALAQIARSKGVAVYESTKVENIVRTETGFVLDVRSAAGNQTITSKIACGAWGKRSNIDIKWQRPFITGKDTRISAWVGIKYHIRTQWPDDLIGLHNFKDGYCGISKIEDDWYCLCYLTRAANLKGMPVPELEKGLMSRNAALRHILENSERKPGFPLAISQVSFRPKTKVENGVLLLGDAAGMIAPLCGNGMSMALHASKIAAAQVDLFLSGRQDRAAMEKWYEREWEKRFESRLRTGRALQRFFGSELGSNLMVSVMSRLPALTGALIKKTHGAPF
jgi:flavin-dependent dehydrogenase